MRLQDLLRGRRLLFALLAVMSLACLANSQSASAQTPDRNCIAVAEPNDQPPQATDLGTGAGCATSENLRGGQDLYKWTVDESGAMTPWTVAITGVPDQATKLDIYDVTFNDAGEVDSYKLLTEASGGAGAAVSLNELILDPRDYYIGVAISGAGKYQLSVTSGDSLVLADDMGIHDTVDNAIPVDGAFSFVGDRAATADTFVWTLDSQAAAAQWTIALQGPVGTYPQISIGTIDGQQVYAGTVGPDGKLGLPDVGLDAGTYVIVVAAVSDPSAPYVLSAASTTARTSQAEDEPNDDMSPGMPIILNGDSTSITGRLATTDDSEDDVDTYIINADETIAGRYLDIRLLWRGGPGRTMCLRNAEGTELQCTDGDGGIAMHDVVLASGTYTLRITGAVDAAEPYLLKIDVKQQTIAGFEAEPNDSQALASPMTGGDGGSFVASGRLSINETDYFRLTVSGDPQLWLLEVVGSGAESLALVDAAGTRVASRSNSSGTVQLFDLYLTPGDHWIQIQGPGSQENYALKATPLGPPDPNGEVEPNDSLDRSQVIRLGSTRTGRLAETGDYDTYRFSLQNETHLTFELTSPPDALFVMEIADISTTYTTQQAIAPGDALRYEVVLPAGDYSIWLSATVPSTERYQLAIGINDPFALPVDLEPNDSETQARPLPVDLVVDGISNPLTRGADYDVYRLPATLDDQQVVIETQPTDITVGLTMVGVDGASTTIPLTAGTEAGGFLAALPSGSPIYLTISGSGPYHVAIQPLEGASSSAPGVSIAATPGTSVVDETGVTMTLALDQTPIAAYWSDGQRVDGKVTVTNSGSEPRKLQARTAVGNSLWQIDIDPTSFTLNPGESRDIPVTVHIAPDAWADQPVFVAIGAVDDANVVVASAMEIVTPNRDAPPLNVEAYAPLPDALLGGLDVAWTGLGATPVPVDGQDPTVVAQLFDQLTNTGTGLRVDASALPQEYTVKLAGNDPIPVAGFVLDPRGQSDLPTEQVKDFDLELSTDGQTFTPVLASTLTVIPGEQAFVLDQPVMASYARLRIRSAQSPGASAVNLGEWKVIAQPGWSSDSTAGADVGAIERGGHIVDMQPQFDYNTGLQGLVTSDQQRQTLFVAPGAEVSWVVGFRDNRAAQLSALTWQDPPDSDASARFDTIQVEVSLDSPVGPWTSVGAWQLDRSQDTMTFAFEQPTWARFVRIAGAVPGGGVATPDGSTPEEVTWEFPDVVSAIERPQDDTYRSILGEWGSSSTSAIYERLVPPTPIPLDPDAGNDQNGATLLPLGTRTINTASTVTDEDWYQIDVPPGMGRLEMVLTGDPTLGVTVALLDADGNDVPLAANVDSLEQTTYTADVEGGKSYFLRVTQPPTSVVFAFDTSLSIGPFVTTVYQGLGQYASEVQPGKEVVNFLPFGDPLLLDVWGDDPFLLQGAIAGYPRTAGSSDAEGSMLTAMDGMDGREGTKAIVLITDAESSPSQDEVDQLWPGLGLVKPRVFAIQIGGANGLTHSQDLMQDWAQVNNGQYVYVRDQGEMDVAFDRAATILRRPTVYSVTVNALPAAPTPTPVPTPTPNPTPTPEPTVTPLPTPTPQPTPTSVPANGTLSVVAPDVQPGQTTQASVASDASVAIIFDTSGSMLQELDGSTRADVAKTSLTQLVTQTLPPGTNVSLTTFGDTPDSCDVRLVVPAGPLDPDAMSETIQGIPVVNQVRTPIGASLEQVRDALPEGDGPKIIVLVTDGEETCDGDPEAAIRDLIASGIDVHVNIVGFALDDEQLKAQFSNWAQIGNGRYIDAGNQEELGTAIVEAVQPTFSILASDGTVVANGQVGGEPVVVPAGTYTVVIASSPEQRFENVIVVADEETEVGLGEPSGRVPISGNRIGRLEILNESRIRFRAQRKAA